ncbi:16554_t:CDS:2, partial [Dentiscutata heterogama]
MDEKLDASLDEVINNDDNYDKKPDHDINLNDDDYVEVDEDFIKKHINYEYVLRELDRMLIPMDYHIENEQAKNDLKEKIDNHKKLNFFQKDFLKSSVDEMYDKQMASHTIYDNEYGFTKNIDKRECENCNEVHLALQFCEHCIRKYLKDNFPNWTSGNKYIDGWIQELQQNATEPGSILEWIDYDNFIDVEEMTDCKGGCATIYSAMWKDGIFERWDRLNKRLVRSEPVKVILKSPNNADERWLRESFMLVLLRMKWNLRNFLDSEEFLGQSEDKKLIQKIKILYEIASSIQQIHDLTMFHGDLHPGNILQGDLTDGWFIRENEKLRPIEFNEDTSNWCLALMNKCWDENPDKRPDATSIREEILSHLELIYQNETTENLILQIKNMSLNLHNKSSEVPTIAHENDAK